MGSLQLELEVRPGWIPRRKMESLWLGLWRFALHSFR
jgi:hypothetical protein